MSCCGGLNQIATLVVPGTEQGDGPALDVSSFIGDKTIEISGSYTGSYTVLGSNDGLTYSPILIFDGVEEKRQTKVVARFLRLRRKAINTGTIVARVAGPATFATAPNNFVALAALGAGTNVGPKAITDLFAVVPAAGLSPGWSAMCSGDFVGTIALEGSLDGTEFFPIAQFTNSPRSPGTAAPELAPVVIEEVVRYVRLVVMPGTTVMEPVSVTLGGGLSIDISNQVIAAEWPVTNYRIYAIDFVNGLDTNTGFADAAGTSSADYAAACVTAGAAAKKTLAGLAAIFPRVGNGRLVEIVIRNGGVNTEQIYAGDLDDFLAGSVGWGATCPTIRATGTNTTAGATAFAGDVNEFDYAGGITVPGLNAPGYNPTGAATTTSLPCTQVGGAAPAFPAEPAAPLGWRIRFDNATTTAALRNQIRQIAQVATATLTPQTAFSAVPVATDVFYVEQAGVACGAYVVGGNGLGPSTLTRGVYVIGIRSTAAVAISDSRVRFIFCGAAASTSFSAGLFCPTTGQNVTHNILGVRIVGGGLRIEGTTTIGGNTGMFVAAGLVVAGTLNVQYINTLRWGPGCYATTLNINELVSGVGPDSNVIPTIGGLAVTLAQPRAQKINVRGSMLTIGGSRIENAGAVPALSIAGRCVVAFQDNPLAGSTGNTDVGVDLTASRGSLLILTVTPTVTGTNGDLRLAGGQIVTWTQAIATGIADSAGNKIIGTAGVPAQGHESFTGTLLGGAGATLSYLADQGVGLAANNVVAFRRPTSFRLMTRLRVTNISNTAATATVVTLYQNGVATLMTLSIPGGTAANTKFETLANPILFLDNDDFDVRLDHVGADAGSVVNVSAAVEWAA